MDNIEASTDAVLKHVIRTGQLVTQKMLTSEDLLAIKIAQLGNQACTTHRASQPPSTSTAGTNPDRALCSLRPNLAGAAVFLVVAVCIDFLMGLRSGKREEHDVTLRNVRDMNNPDHLQKHPPRSQKNKTTPKPTPASSKATLVNVRPELHKQQALISRIHAQMKPHSFCSNSYGDMTPGNTSSKMGVSQRNVDVQRFVAGGGQVIVFVRHTDTDPVPLAAILPGDIDQHWRSTLQVGTTQPTSTTNVPRPMAVSMGGELIPVISIAEKAEKIKLFIEGIGKGKENHIVLIGSCEHLVPGHPTLVSLVGRKEGHVNSGASVNIGEQIIVSVGLKDRTKTHGMFHLLMKSIVTLER